jgi:hypothetical protein
VCTAVPLCKFNSSCTRFLSAFFCFSTFKKNDDELCSCCVCVGDDVVGVGRALVFLSTEQAERQVLRDPSRPRAPTLKNIHRQQKKLYTKLHIVKAVDVNSLPDEVEKIEQEHSVVIPHVWGSKAETACYLSHLKLLQCSHAAKYVVVFEDDFLIATSNFENKLNTLLQKLERARESFDVLYLGNLTNYRGEPSSVNECTRVQNTNMACWGAHAYVVRTDRLKRWTQKLNTISESYDGKLQTLAYAKEIKSLALTTNWVTQFGDDQSYIREVPYHLMPKNYNTA